MYRGSVCVQHAWTCYCSLLQIVWDKEKGKWVDLDAGDEVALSTLSVAPIALTNTCSCATLLMHL